MTKKIQGVLLGSAFLLFSHNAMAQTEPPTAVTTTPAEATQPEATPAPATPAVAVAPAASDRPAPARRLAVAARVSTLGLGAELIGSVHRLVNLRLQGNFFDYSKNIEEDGVDYDGKLKLQTFGLLADVHPFAGGFRLSGGLYQNGNQLDLDASCRSECEVGDLTIVNNAGDNGRVFGGAKFNSLSPYLGLGFGNAMRGSPLHFGFDVGVLLQGAPRITLGADGTATVRDNASGRTTRENLATNREVQDALREEAINAEDDTKEFKYYPVANLTIGYRFGL